MDKNFSHRNGERTPPVEDGMYWVTFTDTERFAGDPVGAYVYVLRKEVYRFMTTYFDDLDEYNGAWYGPIPDFPELMRKGMKDEKQG